jgi:hypothetical protein
MPNFGTYSPRHRGPVRIIINVKHAAEDGVLGFGTPAVSTQVS